MKTARDIAEKLPVGCWKRLSAGEGTKGPRLYDWAYIKWKDRDASEYNKKHTGLWTAGLLISRSIADKKFSYYTTWCSTGTALQTLVNVLGFPLEDRGVF